MQLWSRMECKKETRKGKKWRWDLTLSNLKHWLLPADILVFSTFLLKEMFNYLSRSTLNFACTFVLLLWLPLSQLPLLKPHLKVCLPCLQESTERIIQIRTFLVRWFLFGCIPGLMWKWYFWVVWFAEITSLNASVSNGN